MYERFTDRARKVMQLANQEAQRLNHEYVGTEHILLALVKEGSGVAANVLNNFDIDIRKIRIEVEKIVGAGPDLVTMGRLPHTPRVKKAIEHAIEEARNLSHEYIGTEHLLLGLLCDTESVAGEVLRNLRVSPPTIRAAIIDLLSAYSRDWSPISGMFDQPFTPRAFLAMEMAREQARREQREYVGTEHVLLSISARTGLVANLLKEMGADFDRVQAAVRAIVPAGPFGIPAGSVAFTARTRSAVEYAAAEARADGRARIDTEHALLGLLRSEPCMAAKVLANLGVDSDKLRKKILANLSSAAQIDRSPGCAYRDQPGGCWLMAMRNRQSGDVDYWRRLPLTFGALVGAGAGWAASGKEGAAIGFWVGCAVGTMGWFAPAGFLGSLVGAALGNQLMDNDAARLLGAVGGTGLAALVLELCAGAPGFRWIRSHFSTQFAKWREEEKD
jgi:ATP-dependent Clp protease ATP-binding subunit ClpA